MKIGILTYHRSHNYGALLQAYALKAYLKKMGYNAEHIDYFPNYHREIYKVIPFFKSKSFLGKTKALILALAGGFLHIKRKRIFNSFIKKQFNVSSKPLYTKKEHIMDLNYDIVIYGSDQIWRKSNFPTFNGYNDVYFGKHPRNVQKKISYAASMGVMESLEEDYGFIKQMMNNFESISVREDRLKDFLLDNTNKEVCLVLDPVFLLDANEWLSLVASNKVRHTINKKYILFYRLTPSREGGVLVEELKTHLGIDVVEIRGKSNPLKIGSRVIQTAGPIDFVSLIYNAEAVVTSSFHGLAFAIIFKKQFFAFGMGNNSERAQSLLKQLNIANRYVNNIAEVSFCEKIDYGNVDKTLGHLKNNSRSFLQTALS